MDKTRITKLIDDMFNYLMDEAGEGITREDVFEPAIYNFIAMYENNEIAKDELLSIGQELDVEYDIDVIDKEIEKKKQNRLKRAEKKGNKVD